MDRWKAVFAQKTDKRTLAESSTAPISSSASRLPGVLKPDMVAMGQAADDGACQSDAGNHAGRRAQGAPGRHDLHRAVGFPNQVNNVLCFPFIFRGALDVGATTINEEMKQAAVHAIAAARA
jgi:malate dehydrogenase (oxaloacetate-decarboxylating)(NADP+)